MQLSEIQFSDAVPIESYGPDFFRVGDERIAAPAVIFAEGAMVWEGLSDPAKIIELADRIDFILLGTGAELRHAPADFRAALEAVFITSTPIPAASSAARKSAGAWRSSAPVPKRIK